MKYPAVRLLAVAVLVRTVLASMPVLADDLLEQASAEAMSVVRDPEIGPVQRELLQGIADWLSTEFQLSSATPPYVEFVTPERLGRLRFRGVPSDDLGAGRDVVALYDDEARTIYLPRGWSGKTAAEMSILVHEMVHHAQNLGGTRFGCLQEREKLAYEAQQRWLERHGSDLATAFQVDGFTLLVLTNCGL